eukprot:scaffold47635_cov18-Tisochrysis_lutea.AAC.2
MQHPTCASVTAANASITLCEDLGRLFLLDMVLGNADRLPCSELGWRGNPGNVLLGAQGEELAQKVCKEGHHLECRAHNSACVSAALCAVTACSCASFSVITCNLSSCYCGRMHFMLRRLHATALHVSVVACDCP